MFSKNIFTMILVLFLSITIQAQEPAASEGAFSYTSGSKDVTIIPDVRYGPGDYHFMDIYMPEQGTGPFPCYVMFHGGSFTSGSRKNGPYVYLCTELAERGIVAISGDYTLSPDLNVGIWEEHLQARKRASTDIRRCITFIHDNAAQCDVDPDAIFAGGSSAGAAAALTAVVTDPEDPGNCPCFDLARGVVSLWGNLPGPDGILVEDIGINYFQYDDPAVCVVHGTADTNPNTPYEAGVEIIRQAQESAVYNEFYPLEGAGHNAWEYLPDIVIWIDVFMAEVQSQQ